MTSEMSTTATDIRSFVAHEQIRQVVARVARGEDRRDATLIGAAFWPDATVDFGIFAGSFAEYLAWVVPGSPAVPVTQHVLGQTAIELKGEVALAETHVNAYHRVDYGTEHHDVMLGGRYLDRLEERDGEWRIAQRTMLYDWTQDFGVSADWSQGLMGEPFSGAHFTGRSTGDHSATFFGQ
ncbi:nuclear transport factor 2 family protein [Nocardia sp. alder85J]|uniref:nuclear transport factor 2 family protein n=1 Tax=Nocardia sp. alder85J TaxID=2862949 RepID=UPI001CD53779|nr:nuclear transport factor 2 family protein [Nocardia sp. alder85J]MCX4092520.1 nuclear transport factor 2 family protein [Nocardia sp. alder85J]